MLVRHMSTKEARANFADLLGSVYYTKEPVIVERKGKPVAVVISPDEYARHHQAEEERLWQVVDGIQDRNAEADARGEKALSHRYRVAAGRGGCGVGRWAREQRGYQGTRP